MSIKTISENKCFEGMQTVFSHDSAVTKCPMRVAIYLPPQARQAKVPVLFWLSGLTCTEENFTVKAGAQRVAAELGMAIVAPDTSPRGVRFPGDDASYDFGLGAGFYVDATEAPWSANYRMYSYVAQELPDLVGAQFPLDLSRAGIAGHSMGGHGALTIGIKHPERFRSISAFAPISSPMRCRPCCSGPARWRSVQRPRRMQAPGRYAIRLASWCAPDKR
jgi:S-formylglutathione hydrolase